MLSWQDESRVDLFQIRELTIAQQLQKLLVLESGLMTNGTFSNGKWSDTSIVQHSYGVYYQIDLTTSFDATNQDTSEYMKAGLPETSNTQAPNYVAGGLFQNVSSLQWLGRPASLRGLADEFDRTINSIHSAGLPISRRLVLQQSLSSTSTQAIHLRPDLIKVYHQTSRQMEFRITSLVVHMQARQIKVLGFTSAAWSAQLEASWNITVMIARTIIRRSRLLHLSKLT